MLRRIIQIDEEKCDGCGICAKACHEGAIGIVNGKARLLRDDYCDGLGDCLPACPRQAISFVEREAAAYDETAVLSHKRKKEDGAQYGSPCGCPGSAPKVMKPVVADTSVNSMESQLSQWPVQIKLAPVNAPYFSNAQLLVAADCSAYAYAAFHGDFIRGRVTLIGCPKLDGIDYSGKLFEIISAGNIKDITVVRMEVPCCGGIEAAVKDAVSATGRDIAVKVVIISIDGKIIR